MDDTEAKQYDLRAETVERAKFTNVSIRIFNEMRKVENKLKRSRSGSQAIKESFDYSDNDQARYDINRERRNKEKLEELTELKDSPYYGRLIADCYNNKKGIKESEDHYIGKKSYIFFEDGTEIADWRSEYGDLFRKDSWGKKTVNSFEYESLQKIQVFITKGEFQGCSVIYDRLVDYYGQDVIDDGLRNVIINQRNQKETTDIIQTISQTQNELMMLPFEKQFLVQGCAGSGKTAV